MNTLTSLATVSFSPRPCSCLTCELQGSPTHILRSGWDTHYLLASLQELQEFHYVTSLSLSLPLSPSPPHSLTLSRSLLHSEPIRGVSSDLEMPRGLS
jgi:hypothetical protein